MKAKSLRWVLALLALIGVTAAGSAHGQRSSKRPNIIFVLTDDLAWDLVQYMPHVQQMQARGVTFRNYFVTDSLCCPSRASIFTGRYPHDTGIFSNGGDGDGGFALFYLRGEEYGTFATGLQARGYFTGMMGKYLNGYSPGGPVDGRPRYIPPGWNEWDVAGNAYPEFNYNLNENGTLVHYRSLPTAYLTDVAARKGAAFIHRAATKRKPFLLEIATFAPHAPYTPAPRDANDFPGLQAPRTPAFNEGDVSDKPPWLGAYAPLTDAQVAQIDTAYRKRAQSVEAVDDLLARLETALERNGVADNTYIFFSSDNGYHMGDHRLMPGKMTAFETDIRVPLVVTGPGVAPGRTVTRIAENVDLCPTFLRLGGASVPPYVDGQSLVPLLQNRVVPVWRNAALVEHHGPDFLPGDPDAPPPGSGNPPTYEALRVPHGTYVEYANGDREYYNLAADPFELTNTYSSLSPSRVEALHSLLVRLENCHSSATCRHAASRSP